MCNEGGKRSEMDESIIDETVIKEIGSMLMQIQELLKQGLIPLESEVTRTINNRITNKKHLDKLLSDLLDYTQIDEGLAVFKQLCRYCFYLYPQMTAEYIYTYRDLYDPDYANDNNKDEI